MGSGPVRGGSHAFPLPSVCRGLLQVALQRRGQAPEEEEDTETRSLPQTPVGSARTPSPGQPGSGPGTPHTFAPGASLWKGVLLGEVLGVHAIGHCLLTI